MRLLTELIFVVIRPIYALFLAIGAVIGVAASIVIMNLLVGYFAVASDAYTSIHPHITVHGSWPRDEAAEASKRVLAIDPVVERAAPAVHFERNVVLAKVNVLSELCGPAKGGTEPSCGPDRDLGRVSRAYAYEVTEQQNVDVQIRGIMVAGNETVANIRKLMAGEPDLGRLMVSKDSGGNVLPIAFIAQDTLISDLTGTYLLAPDGLGKRYERYFRLHGVVRLGAKSSGAPFVILGLDEALALAPPGLDRPNVIEVRLRQPLEASRVAGEIGKALGSGVRLETWIDKERSAFDFLNATWIMVFSVMLNICLVVAISIYSTLTLSILRNRWKVALLGSLGFTPARIGALFFVFAVGVGLVGVIGGTIVGQFASRIVGGKLYETFLGLAPERFEATLTWAPAAWMGAATLAIFILSALMPLRRAVSVRPAEALSGHA